MIAPLEQSPLIEAARRMPAIAPRAGAGAVAAALRAPAGVFCAALGFCCFMPYPALRMGNASALQAGNVLVLVLAAVALFVPWKGRPFWVCPLLAAPLCISALKVALTGQAGLDLSLKALVVWTLSILAVLATQLVAPRYAVQLLTGIACAVLIHAAVGLWQAYAFSNSEFPLAALYVNPSFLSVQDNATIIARYVRRPFGLFPEPSAMSSSLAPWVLFLLATSCGAVKLWARTAAWQRGLFAAAGLGGLGLIIVSRSGHAAVTVVAVVALAAAWFVRAPATPRTVAGLMIGLGVFLPVVLYFATVSVGDRLGGKSSFGNSSWGERASSLTLGFELVAEADVPAKVFGYGVGQVSPALQSTAGLDAVFSVLLTYLFETGLVGTLAVIGVGCFGLRVWSRSRWDVALAAIAFVWVVGVTLTTSYAQLLPLWITLGWLTVWPQLCRPAAAARARRPLAGSQSVSRHNELCPRDRLGAGDFSLDELAARKEDE